MRTLGFAFLTVFLYVLIAEAAVETFFHKSPVRSWVVIVAVAYIGGSAVLLWRRHALWQRFGWPTRAMMTFFVLFGLLAFTVWQPGGLIYGLTLFGLSTSTLLSLVTIAAIASSGLLLLQRNWPHAAIKWGILSLAAYGVIAFLWGIYSGTSFPALLSGQSLWIRLPRWCQGAFIGALIIVPSAIICKFADALRRSRTIGLEERGFPQVIALGLSWVMALSGITTSTDLSGKSAARISAGAGLTLPSAAEMATTGAILPQTVPRSMLKPDDLVARAATLVRSIPRVRYDLDSRAQVLGPGADPAFRFVRDQIRFEAYPGILHGAGGTYITRAGNAWDRSLLLADLLKRKGLKIRFALGRLPRPQAERLFARVFDPAPALEADAVGKARAFGQAEAEAFMSRLRGRATRDFASIRKALGDRLPVKGSPSRDEVLQEIEAHVWVQADVNGRWVDLDPAFADATPGRTYATVERTIEELPREAYQQVTIRVLSEVLRGSSLNTETTLEYSAPAEKLLDRQIFLTHTPGGGGGLGGAIGGAVLGADAWAPLLWVDGTFYAGKPTSFSDKTAGERGKPPGGGLGGLFGPGGALSAPEQFVAEWLEFEILFPGGRREVTRRALVDRGGIAWRQSGTLDPAGLRPLSRDADGLLVPRTLHNIWFSAGRHNLAGYSAALWLFAYWARQVINESGRITASGGTPPVPPPPPTFSERVWPLAMMSFTFLVRSDHAIVSALNDSPSFRFYADSPRILIVSIGSELRARDAASVYIESDWRRDHLRGLAREVSGESGVVERKIWFGILQGALEQEIIAQYMVAGGGDGSTVKSTSTLLTAEGAIAFWPGGVPAAQVATDHETAAQIARALADKAIVVAPWPTLRGGMRGWWEIASDGADTRAVLDHDVNAAMGDLPPFHPGWGWRPYGWGPRAPWTGAGEPPWVPKGSGPIEQIGPKRPGDVTAIRHNWPPKEWLPKEEKKCAGGGNEQTGVIACVSIPQVEAEREIVLPTWQLAIAGVAMFVIGLLIVYALD